MMTGILASLLLALSAAPAAAAERYLVAFRDGAGPAQREAALKRLGALVIEELPEIGAWVIERREREFGAEAFESAALSQPQLFAVEPDVYRIRLRGAPAFRAPFPTVGELQAALPQVLLAPARTAGLAAAAPSAVDVGEFPWGVLRLNAPAAWAVTQGGGVKVAVLDTGIDCAHPDLASNCAGGYNAQDSARPFLDDNFHGTHVAGTIAGALDGRGVVGVAPKARLYAVKVLDSQGGSGVVPVVKGLIWAGRNGMDVANMSLEFAGGSVFLRAAINYAASRGVAIFAAAGNDGGAVNYPGAYAPVIAVSALAPSDAIWPDSNRGGPVDFIAPGVEVRSTMPGGGYDWYNGTSMAAPHMSGLGALVVARGARGVDAVRAALLRAAKPVPGLSRAEQGAGVVDAAQLVK